MTKLATLALVAGAHAFTCPDSWELVDETCKINCECAPSGLTLGCKASKLELAAKLDHVYYNGIDRMNKDQKSGAKLLVGAKGECTADYDADKDSFTMDENIDSCGATITEDKDNGKIVFAFKVTGTMDAITRAGIINTQLLDFEVECRYDQHFSISTSMGVPQEPAKTIGRKLTQDVELASLFTFDLFSDVERKTKFAENTIEIGQTVFTDITAPTLPTGVDFYVSKCAVLDDIDEPKTEIEIINEYVCTMDDVATTFKSKEFNNDMYQFNFRAFALSADTTAPLFLKCDVEICDDCDTKSFLPDKCTGDDYFSYTFNTITWAE